MIDPTALDTAIERGLAALLTYQHPDGSFQCDGDYGVWPTAQTVIALQFLGLLSDEEADAAGTELEHLQRENGSFEQWPGSGSGDLPATIMGMSGLYCTGRAEAVARARSWVDTHGGMQALTTNFLVDPMMTRMFAAVSGVAPASYIPELPMIQELLPELTHRLESKLNVYVFVALVQVASIRHVLAGDWGKDGTSRGFLASIECANTLKAVTAIQDGNGGWDGDLFQTVLGAMSLRALGMDTAAPALQLAVGYIRGMRRQGYAGRRYMIFSTDVWTTGLALRALVAAGSSGHDLPMMRAVRWLCEQNRRTATPQFDNPTPGAVATGGWSFQSGNQWFPDTDDTGVVLAGLGAAMTLPPDRQLPHDTRPQVKATIDHAIDWLLGMQNDDGGWAAFVHGMPSKSKGPLFLNPPDLTSAGPVELLKIFLNPPPEMGSPATEDVTARILHGLAYCGWDMNVPQARKALAFLQRMQEDDGSWWGMWMVNYLTGTSSVVWALGRLGVSAKEPMAARAIAWLVAHQNPDGGWGETPEGYRDPAQRGHGPSMPALTGWVCSALMAIGLAESDPVRRGIAWLLAEQAADGSWPVNGWRNVFQPPTLFYVLPAQTQTQAVEALGTYRSHLAGERVAIRSDELAWSGTIAAALPTLTPPEGPGLVDGDWSSTFLFQMRRVGDPEADALVAEVFGDPDASIGHRDANIFRADRLIATIMRNDDPIPPGLPPRLTQWFSDTGRLADDTDWARIRRGQALFDRVGWAIAGALFCSSLPQSYACAIGARVLVSTGGLTSHTYARILETAQFIFDVAGVGGLEPQGRGIRAAQKVRLLHAAIRHFLTAKAGWHQVNMDLPINQEELAGTVLSFSTYATDGATLLGTPITAEDAEDWLYLWTRVGLILGVDPRLLPASVAEGRRLATAIRRRLWAPSEAGALLGRRLVECMARWLPIEAAKDLPIAMIRRASGDICADLLGLPRVPLAEDLLMASIGLRERLFTSDPVGSHLQTLSHTLLLGLVNEQRDRKQASFRIPPGLLHAWARQ